MHPPEYLVTDGVLRDTIKETPVLYSLATATGKVSLRPNTESYSFGLFMTAYTGLTLETVIVRF